MVVPGEVISYLDMCREEGINLQRGDLTKTRGLLVLAVGVALIGTTITPYNAERSGKKKDAPDSLGSAGMFPLEPAPGSYVLQY